MLKGLGKKDPPRVKKLAMYPYLPEWLCKWGRIKRSYPQQQAVGDLEMIAFYYILPVGGYTTPKRQGRQPKTQHFLVNDVMFLKLRKSCSLLSPIPFNTSRQDPLAVVTSTLRINNIRTHSRERVCTMEHWKDKYFYVQ